MRRKEKKLKHFLTICSNGKRQANNMLQLLAETIVTLGGTNENVMVLKLGKKLIIKPHDLTSKQLYRNIEISKQPNFAPKFFTPHLK